jgi:hypothetical protein
MSSAIGANISSVFALSAAQPCADGLTLMVFVFLLACLIAGHF